MAFLLHPRLEADTTWLGDLPLCRVLLSKEDIGPWLILVPKLENIKELHHLSEDNQQQFMRESAFVSSLLEKYASPDKINIGALGNMVPQLHVHHIARFITDVAWPGPVWGNTHGIARNELAQSDMVVKWRTYLSENATFVSAG